MKKPIVILIAFAFICSTVFPAAANELNGDNLRKEVSIQEKQEEKIQDTTELAEEEMDGIENVETPAADQDKESDSEKNNEQVKEEKNPSAERDSETKRPFAKLKTRSGDAVASIGETEYPSLQDAINAVDSGETIELLADTVETVTVTSKTCTIKMNGHCVTGQNGCVFDFNGGTVTVENGIITGGSNGGIRTNDTNLTLNSVTVKDNEVQLGGGIKAAGGSLILNNCTIEDNKATQNGGGIYTNNTNLAMSNTKLSGNTAESQGGALYFYTARGNNDATISGGSITDNKAGSGSAIYASLYPSSNKVSLEGTDVKRNVDSSSNSGPISLSGLGNTCNIKNCDVSENTGGIAGAIRIEEVGLNASGSRIYNNKATSENQAATGGIYVAAYAGITMNSGLLKDNTTAGTGKANDLYINRNASPVSVMKAAAMDCENSEYLSWVDEVNDLDLDTAISRASMHRYFTAFEKDPPEPAIYIDGQNGSDDNTGLSEDSPVKTFAKAKEVIEANPDIHTIYVTGRIDVTDEQEWSLPQEGDKLLRSPGYTGTLVRVAKTGTLKLKDLTIDGNSEKGVRNGETMFDVYGTLEAGSGAVLQNNDISQRGSWAKTWGGAVLGEDGSIVTIDGGTIKNCSAIVGGGICSMGTVNLKSGSIENNHAITNSTGTSSGGGIALIYDGRLDMSGGTISGNSGDYGGGVAVGAIQEAFLQRSLAGQNYTNMTMTGGTIEGNTAAGSGGGIFIQMNGTADVTEGIVSNNVLEGLNSGIFGGGGIYVNGGKKNKYDNGLLKLDNVVIKDNEANSKAAGIASCPSSSLNIYLANGGAVYDNTIASGNSDVFTTSIQQGSYAGHPTVYVSDVMLGGGEHNWKNVGDEDGWAENALLNYTVPSNTDFAVYSSPSESSKAKAEVKAKVLISDNTSDTAGGGIGSNGDVVIGESGYGNIRIAKTVSGEGADENKKFTFRIKLSDESINGEYGDVSFENGEGTFTLKHGENASVYKLPEGIEYEITEDGSSGYETISTGEVSGTIESDKLVRVQFDNAYTPPEAVQVELSAEKRLDGAPAERNQFSFVLRDSKGEVQTVKNDGKDIKFDPLSFDTEGTFVYTLEEIEGNETSIEYDDTVYTITITITKDSDRNIYEADVVWSKDGDPIQGTAVFDNYSLKSIDVKKEWVGEALQQATVHLLADGERIDAVELNAENEWQHTFTGLSRYASDGHEIVYEIEEDQVERYQIGISGTPEDGFTVTNTISGKVSVPVTKVWSGPKTDKVTINLLADGEIVDSVDLNKDNNWQHTFADVEKYKNGKEIVYTVEENRLNNYKTEISGNAQDGYIIKNTNTETRNVDVTKVWEGTAASEVTIHLYADGKKINTSTITKQTEWKHTFESLPVYAEDGHEIEYTVKEDQIEGYTGKITGNAEDGFTITNTEKTTPPTEDKPDKPKPDKPDKPSGGEAPKTGDKSNLFLWFVLMIISASGVAFGVAYNKKKSKVR